MREFSFYSAVTESALYRYQVRETGQVYSVTISVMQDDMPERVIGRKVLRNISRHEVIRECLSHCRRSSAQRSQQRAAWLSGLRNWALSSMAVLAFIRLMIVKS